MLIELKKISILFNFPFIYKKINIESRDAILYIRINWSFNFLCWYLISSSDSIKTWLWRLESFRKQPLISVSWGLQYYSLFAHSVRAIVRVRQTFSPLWKRKKMYIYIRVRGRHSDSLDRDGVCRDARLFRTTNMSKNRVVEKWFSSYYETKHVDVIQFEIRQLFWNIQIETFSWN